MASWKYEERNNIRYRYKSTEWLEKISQTNHATIEVQYYNERHGWNRTINWNTLDYFVATRNAIIN